MNRGELEEIAERGGRARVAAAVAYANPLRAIGRHLHHILVIAAAVPVGKHAN